MFPSKPIFRGFPDSQWKFLEDPGTLIPEGGRLPINSQSKMLEGEAMGATGLHRICVLPAYGSCWLRASADDQWISWLVMLIDVNIFTLTNERSLTRMKNRLNILGVGWFKC